MKKTSALVNCPLVIYKSLLGDEESYYILLPGRQANDFVNLPDKTIVWQDMKLFRSLKEKFQDREILLALPVNESDPRHNLEYIVYNPDSGLCFSGKEGGLNEAYDNLTFDICVRLRQLHKLASEIAIQNGIGRKKLVYIFFDGDEGQEAQERVLDKVKKENPGSSIKIFNASRKEDIDLLRKNGKLIPFFEILSIGSVYTIKSALALYLLPFAPVITENGASFQFSAEAGSDDRSFQLYAYFYRHILKNTFLFNQDSLACDIMDPLVRIVGPENDRHLKLEEAINKKAAWNAGAKNTLKFIAYKTALYKLFKRARKLSLDDSIQYIEASLPEDYDGIFNNMFSPDFSKKTRADSAKISAEFFRRIDSANYDDGIRLGESLLAAGVLEERIFIYLISASVQLGKFRLALAFALIGQDIFYSYNDCYFTFQVLRLLLLLNAREKALRQLALLIYSPNKGNLRLNTYRIQNKIKKLFGDFNWEQICSALKIQRCKGISEQYIRLLLGLKAFAELEKTLPLVKQPGAIQMQYDIAVARYDLEKVLSFSTNGIWSEKEKYNNWLRYLIMERDYDKCLSYLNKRKDRFFNLSFPFQRTLFFRMLKIYHESFKSFSRYSHFHLLDKYKFKNHIKILCSDIQYSGKILFLSECFLGDELRYSKLYGKLAEKVNPSTACFTCDRRIYSLLKRSYPWLNFIPTSKSREIDLLDEISSFNKLPGLDLMRYFDSEIADSLNDYAKVITVGQALQSVVRDEQDLEQLSALKPDAAEASKFRNILKELKERHKKKWVIGLSFRSNLSDLLRDLEKLDYRLLKALLKHPDILWVNCQYDPLRQEELDFFSAYPGNFVSLPDLDQFNDVDDTAAMYSQLDLMVSYATFSADLAAAVGVKTIYPVQVTSTVLPTLPPDYSVFMEPTYEYVFYPANDFSRVIHKIDSFLSSGKYSDTFN